MKKLHKLSREGMEIAHQILDDRKKATLAAVIIFFFCPKFCLKRII